MELTPVSRTAFAIGAVAFTGAAALLARIEDVLFPALLWAAPAVPLLILAVIARDARRKVAPPVTGGQGVRRASTLAAAEDTPASRALAARAQSPRSTEHELAQIAWRHAHLRAAVAANPATPAAVLEWLATHGDPEINAAIAGRASRSPGPAPSLA
ncbi:hypothetical protein [Demequina sp. NBRC 110053]|uniref:variant leucine-rich repeat-containing protein n=1 Tax=Demequina sp. NBRC 110053 TaxID=1570342 RepID=UPI001184BDFB|nr:hypothetical protein [Demequina sp. NBRC 110053]